MALLVDPSTPAIATGDPTATTASFTPPAGSLLLVGFSANSSDFPNAPTTPTITDNLGSHLTYTLSDWASRPTSGVAGQVAFWTAPVISSAAMTVSVTANDIAGVRQCAVSVWVLTGADGAVPVGAHGMNSSTSASAIVQSYTAAADSGQGFLVSSDWSAGGAATAGSGCTLDGSAVVVGQFTWSFEHRTNADDSVGGLTTLNLNLPGTSTALSWAYIEILPGASDPPQKDPPPQINYFPPGRGAPNGMVTPWLGTANAGPVATGLIIHPSSPEAVVNGVGTVSALTTSSFTPPAGSLLLVLWAANSVDSANPSTPTITDSLGTPLTYTLSDWQSRADAPTVDGQAAAWTAPVVTSAPMTVTVNNNAGSGSRHAEMQVLVLTGQAASPVGAHGKTGSTSAAIIAQAYTAAATGGQGFLSVSDWNAVGTPTPDVDCWLANTGTAGIIPGQISYAQIKRTIADDVNTVSNRLNASLHGTSAKVCWIWIEILPASTTINGTATLTGAGTVTALVIQQAVAGLTGVGALTAAGVIAGAATLTGAGVLTASATVSGGVINGTATIIGAGTLTSPVVQGSATSPSGAGTLAATTVLAATAAPVGAGALAAPVTQQAGVTAAGGGALTALVTQQATAVPAGAGVLTVSVTQAATASLAGAGTLTSPAVQRVVATLTGAGAMTAVGTVPGGGTAALAGAGALTATATQGSAAGPVGAGTLTAAVTQNGKAAPTAAGALTATGVIAGAASLAAVGSMSSAVRQLAGATLTGAGTLTAAVGATQQAANFRGADAGVTFAPADTTAAGVTTRDSAATALTGADGGSSRIVSSDSSGTQMRSGG